MNQVRQVEAWLDATARVLVLAGLLLPGAPASGSESPQDGRARVRLQAAAGGSVSLFLNDRQIVTTEELRRSAQTQLFDGLAVSLTKNQQFITIQGRKQEVVVEAEGLRDWAAKIATNDVLQVRMAPVKRVMDFITPVENQQPVVMRFVDGAKAAMNAGSTARLDYFEDQSYYFSGQGKVETVNADGAEKELSIQWPPMAGGPLVSTNGSGDKAQHMMRVTPIIHVGIAGNLKDAATNAVTSTNQGLTILVGDRRVQLRRGEAREVAMPNGSVIDFSYPPDTYRLDWRVRKGFFYITLYGFECWEAMAITDQRGWYQWDVGSRAIDITNRTPRDEHPPNKFILCALSRTFTGRGARVTIAPLSMFQYIQVQNCEIWAGAGDGDTKLYTPAQKLPVDLGKGNQLVRSGLPVGADSGGPKQKVGLSWDPTRPLDVTSSKGGAKIPPDTQQTVSQGDAGQLDVNYTAPGIVSTTAIGGGYTLEPKILNNWTFDVLQGDGVSFNLDKDGGVFIVQADPNNAFPVRVGTPGQTVPVLDPGTSLTFILGDSGTYLAGAGGGIIFFESAGANTPAGFGSAPTTMPLPDGRSVPVPFGTPIDPLRPRILEPPVTVSGKE